jgi:TPR repeat protein
MINYLEKYLKYKNKYLKIKKQVGGMKKNYEFVVEGKTITADIPDNFFDDIFTLDIMVDPVTLSDGFTYEHLYVIEWLRNKNISPQTGAVLKNKNMTPNITLKKIIKDFLDETYSNGYYNIDNFLKVYKMDNPVILSDGYSYDHKYAEEWLKDNDVSPTTGEKLLNKNIIPNQTLKNIIEDLLVENNSNKLNKQIGELERLVNSGDCCAQYQLGLKYYLGEGLVVKNLKKALDLLKKSSINCESSKKLLNSFDFKDTIFEEGRRLYKKKDYVDAAWFWNEAVLLKHADAHAFLSDMLIDGRLYVPTDYCRAFKLASNGVILGSIHSKGVLSRCYIEGKGVLPDDIKGLILANESANGNSYFGQAIIGICYKYSLGVPFDGAKAMQFLRLAVEHGYPLAQKELGDMFVRAIGVTENKEEGLQLLRLAAEQGDRESQYRLGEILLDEQKNSVEGMRLMKDAANQKDANAQYYLGTMYDFGEGVPKDGEEAKRWYKLAAEQGQYGAMDLLGEMYFFGRGVIKNNEEAMRWWRLAVEHGGSRTNAKLNLGIQLLDTKDEAEGVRLIIESANHGIAEAQNKLANMYYFGKGVPQNLELAVLWCKRAAEQGLAEAQNRLGMLYSNGDGVAQDDAEAERWYSLARAQGFYNRHNEPSFVSYSDSSNYSSDFDNYVPSDNSSDEY